MLKRKAIKAEPAELPPEKSQGQDAGDAAADAADTADAATSAPTSPEPVPRRRPERTAARGSESRYAER